MLATAVLLQSCAAAGPPPGEIRARDDQFNPNREYSSGKFSTGTHPNLAGLELIGRIDRQTGAPSTVLKVEYAYLSSHKRYYLTARNERAQPLRVTPLTGTGTCRSGKQCPYTEVLSVELPVEELRAAAPAGDYRVKLFARHGPETTITIPKSLIVKLLGELDADRERRPVKPS